jgi:septal ring-binding cell division protein DamX
MKLIARVMILIPLLAYSVIASDDMSGDTGEGPKDKGSNNQENTDSSTPLKIKNEINTNQSTELTGPIDVIVPEVSSNMLGSYAVQIGAFNTEENALAFTENAKSILKNKDIRYAKVGGQYKIWVGKYGSLEEAAVMLNNVFNDGYTDVFVVEIIAGKN